MLTKLFTANIFKNNNINYNINNNNIDIDNNMSSFVVASTFVFLFFFAPVVFCGLVSRSYGLSDRSEGQDSTFRFKRGNFFLNYYSMQRNRVNRIAPSIPPSTTTEYINEINKENNNSEGFESSLFQSCNSKTCANGGSCLVTARGSTFCACARGFKGESCEVTMTSCSDRPCSSLGIGGTCNPTTDGYNCQCQPGYSGKHCDQCLDGFIKRSLFCIPPKN